MMGEATVSLELDAEVARIVFGVVPRMVRPTAHTELVPVYTANPALSDGVWTADELRRHGAPPRYSTDIRAAWVIVEWLRDHAHHPEISPTGGEGADYPNGWQVEFYDHAQASDDETGWAAAWGETAPLAICRAALKAQASKASEGGKL